MTTNMAVHCKTTYASCMNPQPDAEVRVSGWSDLIAFDRPLIANPDLPARIANNWPLNPVDRPACTAQWVKATRTTPLIAPKRTMPRL
jgi:2,4-dienoyl-CoA reductase-like NADH-dependent reductase (Old Yellow Enzyme family)